MTPLAEAVWQHVLSGPGGLEAALKFNKAEIAPEGTEAAKDRLQTYVEAMYHHGSTDWPGTDKGRGGIAGRMVTHEDHGEVVAHLLEFGIRNCSLKQAADDWERKYPGSARLDQPPRHALHRGPDGRPV